MARPRRSAARKYYDRVANIYDHSYEDDYWRWHDTLTWESIKPHLPSDLSAPIIDLGCGTGVWGAKLLASGFHVTFLDISPKMVDQAWRRIEEAGKSDRAEFVVADLTDLRELPARHFGLALAMGEPIGCTPSPARALRQIRRILREDGCLIATFDNKLAAIDYFLEIGDPAALARFLNDGRTNWLTKRSEEQYEIATYTPQELRGMAERCGYKVTDLVGKTVLPMRHHRTLLEKPQERRHWKAMEQSLCREISAIGRCAHLQITLTPSSSSDDSGSTPDE